MEPLKEFQKIPGVGPSIAQDFIHIGLRSLEDLKNKDPQKLYDQICQYQGAKVDRCLLYVCRLAVYFVEESHHDSELLKWWNWKDI